MYKMTDLVKNLDLLKDYEIIKIPAKQDHIVIKSAPAGVVKRGGTVIRNPYETD